MKMIKQFLLVPTLAIWIVCAGLVIMSSCGSNRGSATERNYPGNPFDEPKAAEHSEEGVHEGEAAHGTEQPGEAPEEKREQAGEVHEAADSTAKADTTKAHE
jgi:hypothetical protein